MRRRVLTLAALAGFLACLALGVWQLQRAAYKRALQQTLLERAQLPPLAQAELPAPGTRAPEALLQRRVQVQGEWLAQHSLYLDNRPMDGRVGFLVLTPLRLAGRGDVLLVQRGWVPRDAAQRERLPPLSSPAGLQTLQGRLMASPSRAYELGSAAATGVIRQNVDLPALQAETGLPLLPLVLLQTEAGPGEDASLKRHWPAPAVDIHKHYGYAFQWFALAALILGLYVWFQVLAPRRRPGG